MMQAATQSAGDQDSVATLAAAGVIAYVAETLGHEALGHGSMCMALGGRIEAIAPLWMRCSIASHVITAAGPLFNILAAVVLAVLLYQWARFSTLTYLLWLACAFNALVACGYLMVGGATAFGDWAVLFGAIEPAFIWRSLALALGLAGYLASLKGLSVLYCRLQPGGPMAGAVLQRRLLIPGIAAALVACGAELAAGQRNPAAFVLPLACTIVPALTLLSMQADHNRAASSAKPRVVPFSRTLVALGLLIAAFFIVLVGGGAGLLSA